MSNSNPYFFPVYPQSHQLKLDIAFAVGGSGPDAEAILQKQKEFIITFVQSYRHLISNGQIRIAIITYDNTATMLSNFPGNSDVEVLKSEINRIRLQGIGAAVDKALNTASKDVFSQQGSGRRRVLLLFTDYASSNNKDSIRKAMELLRLQGVTVIAFGIGNKVSIPYLANMATNSNDVILAETTKAMMYYYYAVYRRILESEHCD